MGAEKNRMIMITSVATSHHIHQSPNAVMRSDP